MNADEIMTDLTGCTVNDLKISLININSSPDEGVETTGMPTCLAFMEACWNYYPSLIKSYKLEIDKNKQENVATNKIFVPPWISPSSNKHNKNPIDFHGHHDSEQALYKLGAYATHQMLPIYTNTNMVAALASKKKYASIESTEPELLVPESGYTLNEVQYCIQRGMCNEIGLKSSDYCRYIAKYKYDDFKTGVVFICGDYDFLTGSSNIFNRLFSYVDILKKQESKYKTKTNIKFEDEILINQKEENNAKHRASISFARLIGGSILVHDLLVILRDIYKVKKIVTFDISNESKFFTISIQSLINDYQRIKQYYALNKALKFII